MPRINPPNFNSVSRLTTYYLEDADAINILGNQLASKSIKIRTSQNLTGSYKVGTSKLISEINDGSYKNNYLSFWERFCAFFAGLVDRNAGIKYLVNRIENKAAFVEALIEQLNRTSSQSTENEILSEALLETIDNMDEQAKTSWATGIFDKLCQMEDDSSEKERLGQALFSVLEIISKNNSNAASNIIKNFAKNVSTERNSSKKEHLISCLAYVGYKCSTTGWFLQNLLDMSNPNEAEEDVLKKVLILILKNSLNVGGINEVINGGKIPDEKNLSLICAIPEKYYQDVENELSIKLSNILSKILDNLMFEKDITISELNLLLLSEKRGHVVMLISEYLNTRQDDLPLIPKGHWNYLASSFEKIENQMITKFIEEIKPNESGTDKITQWENIRQKWEKLQRKKEANFRDRAEILTEIKNNKIHDKPENKILKKILQSIQDGDSDLFGNTNLDFSNIIIYSAEDRASKCRMLAISTRLVNEHLFGPFFKADYDTLEEISNALLKAYNQYEQKQLWNEVAFYNSNTSDNSEASSTTSPENS